MQALYGVFRLNFMEVEPVIHRRYYFWSLDLEKIIIFVFFFKNSKMAAKIAQRLIRTTNAWSINSRADDLQ